MERMKGMRIADNAAMLEIGGNGNFIYPTLTWGNGSLVLIDTGFPGQTDAIAQAIAEEGFSASDLTHIIITHQDMDHIGCALDFLKLAPSAIVLAHEDEAPYIDGRETPIKLKAMLDHYEDLTSDQKAWCDKLNEGVSNRRIPIGKTLKDKELLPICSGIETVHTPGHTPGHICLYLKESRTMAGGDALNIEDGKLIGPNPLHTCDMELGLKSLEKVKAYDVSGFVSYHCGYLKVDGEASI
jgi:glyoxylase-like metal-dependent hydrolase (beta-lactamase superfamily II)